MSIEARERPENAAGEAAASARPQADADAAVLRTLLYYRIFRFPLRAEEVETLSGFRFSRLSQAREVLAGLAARGLAGEKDGFHFVGDAAQVEERRACERRAEATLPRALRRSRLIARFPFVRGVALTGTLSKGVFHDGDDVDFFVVTAKDRVWVCRTLLMLFKKVVLLDSHRFFCVNYLLAEDALVVPDRNAFTAAEVAWLKPLAGGAAFAEFYRANPWVSSFLPAWRPPDGAPEEVPRGVVKGLVERVLAGRAGDRLDDRLRDVISRRNRRRYAHLEGPEFDVALRAEKSSSKHHPNHFQQRVLARLSEELRAFEAAHGVRLREAGDA